MFCPSCGHDNIEGVDRCEECMTPLLTLDVPRPDSTEGLARSVMEDKLSQIGQEFLGVAPDAPVSEVIKQMKAAGLGCALILDQGELVGIFTERDLLNKLTGKAADPRSIAVKDLMSVNPEFLRETDSVATALNKMSMGRYRHIPIRKADGSYCVTSIKHVLKYIAKAEW
ncbi:MAG TPA: CBS domain-containing protein [Pyrinomonadaceae bacterium]|nr:CBS domain-containing protein [Pyrinomonadaceae bacterium]